MDNRSLTYEGYNRFLMGNHKRRRKGWQTVKNCKTLTERLLLETRRLNDYHDRIQKGK